jgi:nitroreductase
LVIQVDVFDAIRQRKSVRSYAHTPVSEEVLVRILEAARLAPSAINIQPWHFVVVKDQEKRARIARECRYGKFITESPVLIVGCGNKKASPKWHVVDTTIALEHLVLAATASGLGTCWIGSFDNDDLREMLMLPEEYDIVALIALGYPREKIDAMSKNLRVVRPRKSLEEIVSRGTYGSKNDGAN